MSDIVSEWLEKYRIAWASNDPDDIRALFTEDATYAGSPFETAPWTGHDGIVAGWIENADAIGDYSFEGVPLVYANGIGIIQGHTKYTNGDEYANLWVIHFADDGRAKSFVEWWVTPKE
ncbi:hypothetical protein BH10ACT7_BH10ACT7_31660 [soil metagenome]